MVTLELNEFRCCSEVLFKIKLESIKIHLFKMAFECEGCDYSVYQFCNLVSEREKLLDFLFKHGVLKQNMQCKNCRHELHLNPETLQFICLKNKPIDKEENEAKRQKTQCDFYQSGTKGTFFENSSLPIEEISLFVLYFLIFSAPRQNLLARQLSWPLSVTNEWTRFCRGVCINWFFRRSKKLGGINKVVEISEAELKEKHCNSGIEETDFFVGYEPESGNSFLIPVKQKNRNVLFEIVREWIYVGTKVISKCWGLYNCLEDEGFQQESTEHLKSFEDPSNIAGQHMGISNGITVYSIHRTNYMASLAEFMFKRALPDTMKRLHFFWFEVAMLYSPST